MRSGSLVVPSSRTAIDVTGLSFKVTAHHEATYTPPPSSSNSIQTRDCRSLLSKIEPPSRLDTRTQQANPKRRYQATPSHACGSKFSLMAPNSGT
jgi:hypothetical protein